MPAKKMDYAKHADVFVGRNDIEAAQILGVSHHTVWKWRKKLGIKHPRQDTGDKITPWLGRVPDRIVAKIVGLSKNAICCRRQKLGIDGTRFENWRDKSWIDELLGLDTDERVAGLCEVDVEFVRGRREALGIEPHRRRFMIATLRVGSRGRYPKPTEYELMSVTKMGCSFLEQSCRARPRPSRNGSCATRASPRSQGG